MIEHWVRRSEHKLQLTTNTELLLASFGSIITVFHNISSFRKCPKQLVHQTLRIWKWLYPFCYSFACRKLFIIEHPWKSMWVVYLFKRWLRAPILCLAKSGDHSFGPIIILLFCFQITIWWTFRKTFKMHCFTYFSFSSLDCYDEYIYFNTFHNVKLIWFVSYIQLQVYCNHQEFSLE